jgi:integrase
LKRKLSILASSKTLRRRNSFGFKSCRSDHLNLPENTPDGAKPVATPVAPIALKQALEAVAHALFAIAHAIEGGSGAITATSNRYMPNSLSDSAPVTGPGPVTPAQSQGFLPGTLTVREVVNEFLIVKARAARSDRYLRQLRVVFQSFAQGRATTPIHAVTVQEVEKWVLARGAPRTMRGYLGDVSTLFNFAVRRGYARQNPARAVELPAGPAQGAPKIHTPEETRAVLETARYLDLDVCRVLAVRYFAGVRSAEGHRLTEKENVLLDRGYIEIPAIKAKTRRRRLVRIEPCLAAWLALGGEIKPMGPHRIRTVIRASGVQWHDNVTRHSFCSYHLARSENAAKTALQAGHAEQMLFAHYRELVTLAEADRFWSVFPF